MAAQNRVRHLVDAAWFQWSIIALIVVNAGVLGLETSPALVERWGWWMGPVGTFTVAVFVVEIVLRIYAHRAAFFRDGWSLFDLIVVLVALIPASGGFAVLRALRILRVLRLLSTVKSMRQVVSALIATLPGMASIGALLVMMVYVTAVMSTQLFGDAAPEAFGTLPDSLISLFRIMTGDNWSSVIESVTDQNPAAWLFFIAFILLTTYIVLNLFIAVAVQALERQQEPASSDLAADEPSTAALVTELRTEIARLHERLDRLEPERPEPVE